MTGWGGGVSTSGSSANTRQNGETFIALGRIISADESQAAVTVEHDPIPVVMPHTMTMTFPAAGPEVVRGLRSGQHVLLTLELQSGQLVVVNVSPAP